MKTIKLLAILFISTVSLTSCTSEDPVVINDQEVITTVTVTLVNGSNTVTLVSKDLDGADGPLNETITVVGDLMANTTYTGSIKLENESVTPVENITLEVENESDEHQFFYTSNNATFTYSDMDANGNPIGIKFSLTTGNAGADNLGFTLRHEPSKSATGVSSGDITNAGGSTDVQVDFDVTVQ